VDPARAEGPALFEPGNYRFHDESERPLRAVIGLLLMAMVWPLDVFMVWVLAEGDGWAAVQWGSAVWAASVVAFLGMVGGRGAWMSDGGPADRLLRLFLRRDPKPLDLDDAPAQLLRKRGDSRGALRLYQQWLDSHPQVLRVKYQMAEILHRDLHDETGAARLYQEFVEAVEAAGSAASEQERTLARFARVVLVELGR
jgi:hypothetical protein